MFRTYTYEPGSVHRYVCMHTYILSINHIHTYDALFDYHTFTFYCDDAGVELDVRAKADLGATKTQARRVWFH